MDRAGARRGLVVAALGVMALAAIIVARQSGEYRRGSSNEVELLRTLDPFSQELSAIHPSPKKIKQNSKAHKLTGRIEDGDPIKKLLDKSAAIDARLAKQEAAEKKMAEKVVYSQKWVDDLKAKNAKLHMVMGWPQAGGPMPTEDATEYPASLYGDVAYGSDDDDVRDDTSDSEGGVDASAIAAVGKAIASAYAQQHAKITARPVVDEQGALDRGDMDNGYDAAAVKAAAQAIAQAYAGKLNKASSSSIEDGSASDWDAKRPRNKKQQRTSRHGEGANDEWSNWLRNEENMGNPSQGASYTDDDKPLPVYIVDGRTGVTTTDGEGGASFWSNPFGIFGGGDSSDNIDSPDVQRVKKLMQIQETKERLRKQEEDLEDQVFADAQNGKLSKQKLPADAKMFSAGFIQGAVEASKKSVEQQGKFAKQLETQGVLVKELEDIVHQLEDQKRKDNFDKTAAAQEAAPAAAPVPAPVPLPPTPPPPAPAAAAAAAEPAAYVSPMPPKGFKKVQIDFYMEAECPGCKAFTTGMLTDTLNAVGDWVELRAIPYGNAQLNNSAIVCQHGPDECIGNKIELCMMKRYGVGGDWQAWYPAFKCIEQSDDSPENASKTCLPDSGMDKQGILECAKGDEGDLLHMAAAQMTIDLDPPHKWTPWLVMDGVPMEDKTEEILQEVCKKIPDASRKAIPQCNPKFKAVQGTSSLIAKHDPIQKCYPTDPLSELVLGIHH